MHHCVPAAAADVHKPEAQAKENTSARLRFGLVCAVPTYLAAHPRSNFLSFIAHRSLSVVRFSSDGCHFGSRSALLASAICRDAPRPCENRPLGRIAGHRHKSNVHNRLQRIAARVMLDPPQEGAGAHLASAACQFLYVNTSIQWIATIVPIARNPFGDPGQLV